MAEYFEQLIYSPDGKRHSLIQIPKTLADWPTSANSTGQVNILSIGGTTPGTLFGDNFVTTNRVPYISQKWSQGLLPIGAVQYSDSGNGYWSMLQDSEAPGYFDGASACGLKENAGSTEALIVNTAATTRYLSGHATYFGHTAKFDSENANGNCDILIGLFRRGAISLGKQNEIADGFLWGEVIRNVSGTIEKKFVMYVVKNYVFTEHVISTPANPYDLSIYELVVGYYGIHPGILKNLVITEQADGSFLNERKTFAQINFNQTGTSVRDPNFTAGVVIRNRGDLPGTVNTGAISLVNGSMEVGNYITENGTQPDASARAGIKVVKIDSIAVDTDDSDATEGDGLVCAFSVPDVINMVSIIEGGVQTFSDFENSISSQLLNVVGSCTANRQVSLRIHLVPRNAVTLNVGDDWEPIDSIRGAGYNAIQFAPASSIDSISLANEINEPFELPLNKDWPDTSSVLTQLRALQPPGTAAIVTLISLAGTTATDVFAAFTFKDLF